MQSSTAQPVKTQTLTPNMANIPSPNISIDPSFPTSVPYPDVSQFTFLPDLYLIISRLAPLRNNAAAGALSSEPTSQSTTVAPTSQPQPQPQQQQATAAPGQPTTEGQLSHTISRESQTSSSGGSLRQVSSGSSDASSIELKDLPAHVYSVKQGITRAKETVAGLLDVERSVDMQEVEIATLKRRIEGLNGRLGELGRLARGTEDR